MNDARVGIGHIGWKNVEVKAFEEVIEQWKKHPGLLDETMLPLGSERSKTFPANVWGGEGFVLAPRTSPERCDRFRDGAWN